MEFKEYKLNNVAEMKYGKMPEKHRISDNGFPIYTGYKVSGYYPEYMFDEEQVIIVARGVGGTGDVKLSPPKSYITNLSIILEFDKQVCDKHFMQLYLDSLKLRYLDSGSAQSQITINHLKNLKIKIPLLERQKKISMFIKNFDNKILVNNNVIANLEDLSRTLFKRWFVDFEFPDEEGNPYKSSGGVMKQEGDSSIPIDWDIKSLETIMEITSGKRPKSKKDTKEENYTIPIIGASKTMGYTDSYLFDSRILVMGRVGTHGVIQRYITKCWPSDNTLVIHSKYYNFLYEFLNTVDYKSLNRGSTQPLITQNDIKNLKLPLPNNFEKMDRYEHELNPLLNMIFSLKIENNKLSKLRDTLLPKIMSGEIELPDELEVDEHAELLQ